MQKLQQKIPEIKAWIDATLVAHTARARPVATLGFTRLELFYSAELLATTKAIPVQHVPAPPLTQLGLAGFSDFEQLNAKGTTYLSSYFVQLGHERDESLHFHELVHVVQWEYLGPERFITAYALGHLLCGGYETNPLEVMAYVLQGCFDRQAHGFDVAAAVRTELDRIVPALIQHAIPSGL